MKTEKYYNKIICNSLNQFQMIDIKTSYILIRIF